jgi:hypothetical protein
MAVSSVTYQPGDLYLVLYGFGSFSWVFVVVQLIYLTRFEVIFPTPASRSSVQHSCFVVVRSRIRISARRPSVVTGFSSVSPEICRFVLKLGHDYSFPHPYRFIIHQPPYHSTLYSRGSETLGRPLPRGALLILWGGGASWLYEGNICFERNMVAR